MRPIHEKLMDEINRFGEFEIVPKKGYVSQRRKKQFVMIGPATNTRFEVGINIKGLEAAARLQEQPPASMCNYKIKVADVGEVNDELIAGLSKFTRVQANTLPCESKARLG